MKIIVNGQPVNIADAASGTPKLTYEEIVAIAGEHGHPTVTYRAHLGGDVERSGEMHTGKAPLVLSEDMVLDVIHTG